MQFILTSRNSEEYEINFKLAGFDSDLGKEFIKEYSEENALDLELSDTEAEQLLSLAKGNTLVLVLSMRRLSERITSLSSLQAEFNLCCTGEDSDERSFQESRGQNLYADSQRYGG